MNKVLVDREMLNSALKTIHGLAPGRFTVEEELRAAVTAQPTEAEGVDFGFDDRSVKVSQEAYSIFLARERHHLAALSAVTAERDRLRKSNESRSDKLNEAQAIIDQLRAEVESSKWIPLSEATPPDGVPVLRWPGWGAKLSIDEWCADYGCFLMSIESGERATHWKPLSAPDTALAAEEA